MRFMHTRARPSQANLESVKTLVLGPGGREHAIIRALRRDPAVSEVLSAPGNAGIAHDVPVFDVDATNPVAVVELAQRLHPDLVIIGPEAPLAAGVSDALREAGFDVFGPSQQASQLESSKAFAKEIMAAANVPTGGYHACDTIAQVETALDDFGAPYVVKDDGLAAGKGVVVTTERAEALAHATSCIDAGDRVVVEEFLDGPEVSVFVIADGTKTGALALSPAQDFKRIFNDDEGPNTGGMGAYTPLPWLPEGFTEEVMDKVARPVLGEMNQRGIPFSGVLYCGLAVTAKGIQVIEFNARFGDPETQPVLARLNTPLGQLLKAAARGELADNPDFATLDFSDDHAVGIVLAAEGYPDTPVKGGHITGVKDAEALENVSVLHAGTADHADGGYAANGGRLLAVVGTGEDLATARDTAYAGMEKITLDGGQFRTDIAAKAVDGKIVIPSAN